MKNKKQIKIVAWAVINPDMLKGLNISWWIDAYTDKLAAEESLQQRNVPKGQLVVSKCEIAFLPLMGK